MRRKPALQGSSPVKLDQCFRLLMSSGSRRKTGRLPKRPGPVPSSALARMAVRIVRGVLQPEEHQPHAEKRRKPSHPPPCYWTSRPAHGSVAGAARRQTQARAAVQPCRTSHWSARRKEWLPDRSLWCPQAHTMGAAPGLPYVLRYTHQGPRSVERGRDFR